MSLYSRIKRALYFLRNTPIHPQWLLYKSEKQIKRQLIVNLSGTVLDIGSGSGDYVQGLCNMDNIDYICLDYPGTASRYQNSPDIYADGQNLPIQSGSIDSVILLQVLEHIPDPGKCMSEISRVLKNNGTCYIAVPFIYPIHDEPHDFTRWTQYGIRNLLENYSLNIQKLEPVGKAAETAGLLVNIAFSMILRDMFSKKNPALLVAIFAPLFFTINNILCWLLSLLTGNHSMPHGYYIQATKTQQP